MERMKEQRIKKLKKKRIWPSILGVVLTMLIVCIVIIVELAFIFLDIFNRKLVEGHKTSERIVKMLELNTDLTDTDQYEFLKMHMESAEELKAVSIISQEEGVIWTSNGETPNLDNRIEGYLDVYGTEEPIELVLDDEDALFYFDTDGSLMINETLFFKMNFWDVLKNGEATIFEVPLWFVFSTEEASVCVQTGIMIHGYDLRLPFVSILVVLVLVGLFILYYIVSLVSTILAQRRTTRIIYTDMVTGGMNWLYFLKKSKKLIKRRFKKGNYAVVHLRMPKYRSFCTCFGVPKGEELIERLYLELKKMMRSKEVFAHHEKADFGLLLSYTDQEELLSRLNGIIQTLESGLVQIRLKFRIGVCYVESSSADVEEMYYNAVLAREMQGEDKEQNIAFFNIEMSKQRLWERKVEDDMERALANKEFRVYLQPKFSTGDETLGGAEALVRWIHPTEGFVPPNKFIPIFERNGFILKLDDYMLEEVAKQQAKWIAEGWQTVPISVNVSRAHFTREDLAEHICSIVDKYQVPHDVIELELTESAFFDDKQVLLSTVQKLREAGFLVSMDDFGAGYSSLNSLKELAIDTLKIDADFFRGTDSLDRGMLIVSEVINLAKKLNMKIVAEGIESREQVEFLTEQECDLIQGYYYAKPMPLDEFEQNYKNM